MHDKIDRKKLLDGAVEAALKAGKIIKKYYGNKIDVRSKGQLGLVTNADMEAEAIALKVLKKCEPKFGLLTEETNSQGKQTKEQTGLWIVDPLDGTTNFVHRFPMFCVTIAAEINQKIEVAVTYHPILDELYTAIRGQGSFKNGNQMFVSQTNKIENALLTTGFAYHARKSLHAEMKTFESLSRNARAIRRPGSAALDLAYTACGVFDGFWERHLSAWDVAAGSLLIEEAGGKVTNFKGKKFSSHYPEILASNSKLHNKLLKLV
jgi:myo-inositol-1(or 4)-monophosphatase